MQTFGDRIEYEFKKLVQQEIEEIKEVMANGALMGWEQYKYLSGKIAGYNRALEVLDEAHRKVQEGQ